jgi:7-cyano-7-deazaguanine synthase in queuosine biosynthesis
LRTLIKFGYSAGRIAFAWAGIYAAAAYKPLPATVANAPLGADDYLSLLYRGRDFAVVNWLECGGPLQDSGRALVLFSGGKDSLAVALRLKAQGIAPTLLFAQGINPAYPREIEAARLLSRLTGFSLRIVSVQIQRGHYIENPTKNQMLLAMAADLGERFGISRFAAGIMADDHAAGLNFDSGYSDAYEMHVAAAEWVEAYLPGSAVVRASIKNDTDSILEVADAGLLAAAQSCMATPRFRPSLKKRNQEKYKLELMPERCGSCYKCALEWLHLSLTGRASWHAEYAEHCVAVLEKSGPEISGQKKTRREALEMFIDASRVDISALV